MQPKYGFRQRYDVLCALLREELRVWRPAQLPDTSLEVAFRIYDKIFSKKQQRTIVLQTRNDKYLVAPEGKELGYYVSIELGFHRFFVKPMPVKAKLENEVGLLEWVHQPLEDQDTTDSE